MAKDLFSSKRNKGARPKKPTLPPNIPEEQLKDIDMGRVNSVIDSMSGKSEDEMQAELFATADEQIKSGNLDLDALDNFAKQAAGMLNPEQLKRLNQLTGSIKSRAKKNG